MRATWTPPRTPQSRDGVTFGSEHARTRTVEGEFPAPAHIGHIRALPADRHNSCAHDAVIERVSTSTLSGSGKVLSSANAASSSVPPCITRSRLHHRQRAGGTRPSAPVTVRLTHPNNRLHCDIQCLTQLWSRSAKLWDLRRFTLNLQ